MQLLPLLSALGLNTTLETLFWWALAYFFVFHVVLPFLGELTRNCIRAAARGVAGKVRQVLTRRKED